MTESCDKTGPAAHFPAADRVIVHRDLDSAAAHWSALERFAPTVYQTRAYLGAWFRHLARDASPFIVVGLDDAGEPAFMLPLALLPRGPLRTAVYAGDRHSNANLPIFRDGFTLSPRQAREALKAAARAGANPDVFALLNQPREWSGRANPFAALSHRASHHNAYGANIAGDAEAYLQRVDSKATRKKLKSKARHLEDVGPVRAFRVVARAEAAQALDTLIDQKTERFTEQKGVDPHLSRPATRAFFRELVTPVDDTPALLEPYVLLAGDKVCSVYAGLPHGDHWHGLVNSISTDPDIARSSPGELLLRFVIRDLAARGFKSYDLGIGEARYKNAICDQTIEMNDVVLATSMAGKIWAAGEIAMLDMKAAIKQRPALYRLANRLR
ncbi:MAG: GNAT family N-acetyltransferase [Hyphomicrobiales bacterium]|nr:GNAT family N-acetyltransferase [Hyphomicrobiales bacterium]